jgi:energy-coupling factor transport system ATP-binding protein
MDNVIEVRDLRYTYTGSEDTVLKGIDFTVRKGEIVGIMGPTGAGKTTLCLALSALAPHSIGGKVEGDVIISGMKTTQTEYGDVARKIGIVFQDPETQLFGMEVHEDVALRLMNMGLPENEIDQKVTSSLRMVRLDRFEKRFPYTLSGGEKQRVAIAGALAADPEILILDEPTSELDPVGKREVFDAISELRRSRDTTIIVVEHNSDELLRIADRILVMRDGRVAQAGEARDVLSEVGELGVRIPDTMQLGNLLKQSSQWKEYGYPLTVDDAYQKLSSILRKNRYSPVGGAKDASEIDRGKPIIEVRNLWHIYGKGTEEEAIALRELNLEIYEGDFVALIGQNGSGKTTLAKHFNGLLKPTEGKVLVAGLDTKKTKPTKLAEIVGYCFQNPDHQIFNTRVWDEVAFGPRNLFLRDNEIRERVAEALEQVGLKEYDDRNPFFLGKGERRKIAVASVLAMYPKVLVVDEPSTGMDWRDSTGMMELVTKINQTGKTVIFITHDMNLVARSAKRVIVMAQGGMLLDGPTRWVFSQEETLQKAYIRPPEVTQLGNKLSDYFESTVLTANEAYNGLLQLSSMK